MRHEDRRRRRRRRRRSMGWVGTNKNQNSPTLPHGHAW